MSKTTLRVTAAPARATVAAGPRDQLRQGCLAVAATANQLRAACESTGDAVLDGRSERLLEAVAGVLRPAVQQVMQHPTLQTLTDAFAAADSVRARANKLGTWARATLDVDLRVRPTILALGLEVGLDEVYVGLEGINLLPARAPDYPEES